MEIIETETPPAAPLERKTVEALRDERKTPTWLFAAARAYFNWPIGRELTADEYEAAIHSTKNISIGAEPRR